MKKIYLDHAATTATDNDVLKSMQPYLQDNFGNPSSVHSFGQKAMKAIDESRKIIANFLNCSSSEIIFTSGATESNNLTITGVIKKYWEQNGVNAPIPYIITSMIEHSCILDTCKELEKEKLVKISYVTVEKNGVLNVKNIKEKIKNNTILISIMYVNNEIGTIQPIEKIGELIRKTNIIRDANGLMKLIFHTDAVQAVSYLDCDVKKLGVDLLSFSGHKIYGSKGSGILYIKKGTPIKSIQFGGEQEFKIRPGTQNVPAIVGTGKAVSIISEQRTIINEEVRQLRNYLIDRVLKEIPNSYLNGSKEKRSPNNANFRFDSIEGEGLLLSLDIEGIYASTGSACSSSSLEPSHVLLALGLKHEQAHSSLRITIGKHTTKEELNISIEKIKEIVARLRKISGNILKEFDK